MIIEKSAHNFFTLNFLEIFMNGHQGFIAGGCFKNIFNGEKVKDIDMFFRNETDWAKACMHFDSSQDYSFHYANSKVKAYKHIKTGIRVELCRAIFGTPREVIEQFDFTIAKFAYFNVETLDEEGLPSIETKIIMQDDFFEHLHLKRLVIDDKIPFPMSTLERMFRYIKYGYMPCRETKIRIAQAINELRPEQITVSNSLYNGID